MQTTGVGAVGKAQTRVSAEGRLEKLPRRGVGARGRVQSADMRVVVNGLGETAGGGWCTREDADTRVALEWLERQRRRNVGILWPQIRGCHRICESELVFTHVLRIGEGVPKDLPTLLF